MTSHTINPTGVSTSSDTGVKLMGGTGEGVANIVLQNDDDGSADGLWAVGLTGEKKFMDKGIIALPINLSGHAEIYIFRKPGGANLVNVRGYTLP